MSKKIEIFCKNLSAKIPVVGGASLREIAAGLSGILGFEAICARVNNKTEHLGYEVYSPKEVEFLPANSPSGHRCYVRSLCMVLYKAVVRLYPGVRLIISHSVSRGYYCRLLRADGSVLPDLSEAAEALRSAMQEIIACDYDFVRHEARTEEVVEIMRGQGLDDKVKLLESLHDLYTVYYRLGDIADTYNGCLAPRTGMLGVFDLIPWEQGLLLLGPSAERPEEATVAVAQPKLFRAYTDYKHFNSIIGIRDAGDVNEVVAARETAMMINVAEALHIKYIGAIADRITEQYHRGGAKVVLIAGPSSSGKTTFTKRLAVQLLTNLLQPVMISLDDYFVDRHHTPKDENGDYDYESLYALDLELFNHDLNRLIAGESIELPYYNFEKGEREFKGNRISLGDNSILLIEGIHGLNPELTRDVDPAMKYRVYVSALTTLAIDDHNWVSTTDTRLLRRIIRDYKYRGTGPVETIKRWPSVRRGEERWIFPYQENADSMFNSSLLFELGVMRDEADRVLRTVTPDEPEYAEAYRLRKFLGYFSPIASTLIPPTSLLREFLGGSSFHY